jgi:hypothetical protein
VWAGVDSAWEQKKLEARKMLQNAAESHTSAARFVSPFFYFITVFIQVSIALSNIIPAKENNSC